MYIWNEWRVQYMKKGPITSSVLKCLNMNLRCLLTKLTASEGHPDIVKHHLHVCMEHGPDHHHKKIFIHFHLYFQWKVEVDRNCPTIFLNHTTYLIEVKLNFF